MSEKSGSDVASTEGPVKDVGAQKGTNVVSPSTDHKPNLSVQLFWSPEEKSTNHRSMQKLFPSRTIEAGGQPHPLPRDENITFNYRVGDVTYNVDDFFQRARISGLLVIKNGHIVFERYGNGYSDRDLGDSRSMAKSMTSVMLGLALKDGYISSLDDVVETYVPEFKDTLWGKVSLRHLAQGLSGVPFWEIYDDKSDLTDMLECVCEDRPRALLPLLVHVGSRTGEEIQPGSHFKYSSADSTVMAIVVERAAGKQFTCYLSERVWKPFGMESDGYWLVAKEGGFTYGESGFGATLRDYGRMGLYLLHNGVLPDGTNTLPDGYMREATTPSLPSIESKSPYGYYWWLDSWWQNDREARGEVMSEPMLGAESTFYALGNSGQLLMVNPMENLVMVKWAATDTYSAAGRVDTVEAIISIVKQLH
ncbi:serine hydrolase [Mesorhizobium sp. M8A.F.Ca.ET.165.01.1.1]|uniref:serine hydrolase domain-containing protein n=1 Tax=Mesorhizobium sp. M8A.F.Ca.ET.165.01.1.1 TaxID=2563960 RepID=UPI001AED1FD9|nr:serine hydrolase [Mesorhizobium sp. M8A.F.Ca.ET.165.01.1.1]